MSRKTVDVSVIFLLMLFTLSSCNKSDDLEEIFNGKFKITCYRYNGTWENEKLKELNKSMDIYHMTFSNNTFSLVLDKDISINGTWTADSESREMRISIVGGVTYPSELGRFIVNIVMNATSYSGDHNVLRIYQDKNNYIDLDSRMY